MCVCGYGSVTSDVHSEKKIMCTFGENSEKNESRFFFIFCLLHGTSCRRLRTSVLQSDGTIVEKRTKCQRLQLHSTYGYGTVSNLKKRK